MDARQFLHRVLPVNGHNYYAAVLSSAGFNQHALRSIDAVIQYADRCKRKRADVYFATASFAKQRTQHDCEYKKAFYLDLDCGLDKPYTNKRHAVEALLSFCKEHFVSPTIIVNSGGGVHAYWTLDNEVTTEAWLPIALALKDRCEMFGLDADPTVTADSARILRVPGTFNQKGGTPREVKVIYEKDTDYSVDMLRAKLAINTDNSLSLAKLGALVGNDDLEVETKYDNVPAFATKIIEKCKVLKHTYDTGGADQPEPLWMAQLSLMTYTIDGHEFIHTLSDEHKAYDYNRTEKKYSQRLAVKESGKYGPPLCKSLGMYLPEKCLECKFNGKIKSPIVLGREEDATELPFPYRQDDKNIYVVKEVIDKESGEAEQQLVKVLSFPIENFMVFSTLDPKVGMVFRFTVIKFGGKIAEISSVQLADKRQVLVGLSNSDIPLHSHEYPEFHRLMTTWASKMVQAKKVGQPTPALGWTKVDDKPAFTLINGIVTLSGDDKEVTFLDKEFVKDFTPQGDREPWVNLAKYLTSENRHAVTAGILSAFASPLINFTGVNGCVLALVSDKSGTGKSTALRTAQAVWGDPRRGVNALDDTPLSVANRMGKLNNLPAFWDELRMRDQVEKFVILMFQVSQGKERSRLTSSIQTRHVGTWNTLITVASNESITDHVRHLVHGTDAGLLRVFEVTVPYLQRQQDIDALSASLDKNFGIIGREYAEHLVRDHAQVLSLLEKVKIAFSKKVAADSAERFWVATCSALLTASILTNKLGFTDINISEFTDWLVAEFKRSRNEQVMDFDPVEVRAKKYVMQYLEVMRDQLIIFERLSGRTHKQNVGQLKGQVPRGEILGVFATEDKMVRIKRGNFADWIYKEHQEPHTQIIEALKKQGCLERRAAVTVGLDNAVHTRSYCLDIPLDTMVFDDLLEDHD
jgi:hypothetical protein